MFHQVSLLLSSPFLRFTGGDKEEFRDCLLLLALPVPQRNKLANASCTREGNDTQGNVYNVTNGRQRMQSQRYST